MKRIFYRKAPTFILRFLQRKGVINNFIPPVGKADLGDLNRTSPFSKSYGFKRGGPVDRLYIEKFLKQNTSAIKGNVLEIGDNRYTKKFGGNKVIKSEILHIDKNYTRANYIGDLSNIPELPSDKFDCIIITQTLQFIYDYKSAIATCYRTLKPGGSLLLTVPGISHIGPDEWNWLWSFTGESIKKVLSEVFEVDKLNIDTYGNVLAATAFLYGLGLSDINVDQLKINDPHYQVIISASAVK